jgi:hypothetical protein
MSARAGPTIAEPVSCAIIRRYTLGADGLAVIGQAGDAEKHKRSVLAIKAVGPPVVGERQTGLDKKRRAVHVQRVIDGNRASRS